MRIVKADNASEIKAIIDELTKRSNDKLEDVEKIVCEVIANVKENKDKALIDYARQFDKVELTSLKVSDEEIDEGYNSCSKELIEILTEARDNIIEFHKNQKFDEFEIKKDGKYLAQIVRPMKRAGLYVPGGKSPYPSTVLMDSVPAFVAGVKEVVMVTPPNKEGKISANILAAAKICGIKEIYKAGGAQAIAALAYGTQSIKPVNIICGPGNKFVACAKKVVYGDVAIDMIAGPSEVLIIADETANVKYVAADLLSQAEHDEAAGCFLVTPSEKFAHEIKKEVEIQLNELSRKEIAKVSIDTFGTIIVTNSIDDCFLASNMIAPEHLEIALENPSSYIDMVENAGTIFLGEHTPEPVGDYFAGTNHTIPTSGKAHFCSPLSTYDFYKRTSVVCYSREALEEVKDKVITFAESEELTAHANSIRKRFE